MNNSGIYMSQSQNIQTDENSKILKNESYTLNKKANSNSNSRFSSIISSFSAFIIIIIIYYINF
jgi:hypothetical protein